MKARDFAFKAHAGQKRKYSGEPYTVHLAEVASLVTIFGDCGSMHDEAVQAAWLHDTLEDTDVTYGDLVAEFGYEVARLVDEVTDVSQPGDGNRKTRKAMDCAHLANASHVALEVKYADLISNTQDIVRNDPDFARVYLKEKRAILDATKDRERTHLRGLAENQLILGEHALKKLG